VARTSTALIEQYELALSAKTALDAELNAIKDAILSKVRAELDAADSSFAVRIKEAQDAVAQAEALAKAAVIAEGATSKGTLCQFVYYKPAVTLDVKPEWLITAYPELDKFKKVSNARVQISKLNVRK